MNTLQQTYNRLCLTLSDINEHLPTLKRYAAECDHVTEMGVRWVVSTYALMMGKPKKLVSIDLDPVEKYGISIIDLINLAKSANIDYQFILGNTLQIEIAETDFLFIDTLHTFNQLKKELELHSSKVKKYIGLHDTATFGQVGEFNEIGILPAIEDFLKNNPNWTIKEQFKNNNGLIILQRL